MIGNPKSKIQNPKSKIAFSLLSLHITASMLPIALVLWMLDSRFFGAIALSQTLPVLQPNQNSPQLPVYTPTTPNNPLEPLQPPPEQLPPLDGALPTQFKLYRLGIGDTISVNVERFRDLSFQSLIDLEGNITAPLLGKVQIAGLTLEEAKEKIRLGLNRYVIDPEVTVALFNQRPAQVTIIGEVFRPGFYPLATGSQISAALLTAGGATSLADLRSVIVRRALVDGSIIEEKVDLFTPLQNGQPLPELRLQDGDSVIVSKLEVGTTQDYDRTLVSRSTLVQPQITVRVLSYASGGIGNVTLPNGSTFIDALTAIAPNPDTANLKDIALVRFDPERGKAVTQKIDGKKALLGDVSQNIPLQNYDVIVVGRGLISRITYALNVFTQPFRDILGFLLFFDSLRGSASDLFGPTNNGTIRR